jgi:gliding motility-associated-like protein
MKNNYAKSFFLFAGLLFFHVCGFSQNVIDNCFTSALPASNFDFNSTATLANVYSSDVLRWDGTNWIGGFSSAHIIIPPPTNQVGCRAIFLGNGVNWTTGGESVGLKLDAPLIAGVGYNYNITYVSHGLYSDGNFSPSFYTSAAPSLSDAHLVGALPAVGYSWTTNTISFVATAAQNGDTWIILKTKTLDTSGLINSFCQNCNAIAGCSVAVNSTTICEGSTAVVTATPATSGNYSFQWTVPSGFADPGNVGSFSTGIAGNYSVLITNVATNCTANAAGIVTVNPRPVVLVNSETICQGSTTVIMATPTDTGNYSYQWTVPSGFADPGNVDSLTTGIAGDYGVVLTNTITNCSGVGVTGTVSFFPDFDFTIDQYCLQNNFNLEVLPVNGSFEVGTSDFAWEIDNTTIGTSNVIDISAYLNSTTTVEELPLTINVTVTPADGCPATHPVTIEKIYCDIQKGISPNYDQKNDFFDLSLLNVEKLEIFNRYGTKVFQKSNYTNEWTGESDKGDKLPDGVYYYLIAFKSGIEAKTGWIYLMREYN